MLICIDFKNLVKMEYQGKRLCLHPPARGGTVVTCPFAASEKDTPEEKGPCERHVLFIASMNILTLFWSNFQI